MGSLVYFELKKAVVNRFFAIAFAAAALMCFLLQCGIQEYGDYLQGVEAARRDGEPAEALSFFEYVSIDRKAASLSKKSFSAIAAMTDEELWEAVETNEEYRYHAQTVELLNSAAEERLSEVLRSAESFLSEAEAQGDTYSARRNREILRLYSMPRARITAQIPYGGETLIGSPAMPITFLLILLAAAPSAAGERDRRTWLLLHTSKNGKGKTLAAKYFSGWLIGVGLTAVFKLVSVLALYFKGGLLGAAQPVTAIEELILCPYPLLVWQYAMLSLACQMFTAVILSTILTAVSALSKNSLTACALGALVLGACLMPLYFPPKSEWLMGPLALAEPFRYFNRYYDCGLFGAPVPWAAVQGVISALAGAALALISGNIYCRKRRAA